MDKNAIEVTFFGEQGKINRMMALQGRVNVPTAIALPLKDGMTVPALRKWAERF